MEFIAILLLLCGAGLFVLVYGMRLKAARNEQLLQVYMKALEQNRDPQQLKLELEEDAGDPQGNLKAGVLLLAAALGMVLGLWATQHLHGPWRALGFALVPALLGLGCIFIHFAVPRPQSGS